jgi:hypothetical protein
VHVNIPGRHNVYNALAAMAVGSHFGMDAEKIRAGIESVTAVDKRMQVVETDQVTRGQAGQVHLNVFFPVSMFEDGCGITFSPGAAIECQESHSIPVVTVIIKRLGMAPARPALPHPVSLSGW